MLLPFSGACCTVRSNQFFGRSFSILGSIVDPPFLRRVFLPRFSMVMLAKASLAFFFRFRIELSMAVVFSAKVNAATHFSPLVQVDH